MGEDVVRCGTKGCAGQIGVTDVGHGFWQVTNAILHERGEKKQLLAEVFLCPPCHDIRMAEWVKRAKGIDDMIDTLVGAFYKSGCDRSVWKNSSAFQGFWRTRRYIFKERFIEIENRIVAAERAHKERERKKGSGGAKAKYSG